MQTDPDLVESLVSDLAPVRRRTLTRDVLVVGTACAAELIVFFALEAQRPDMHAAMDHGSFWWRLASLGVISLIAGAIAILSFDPAVSPRSGLRWLLVVIALCLAVGFALDDAGSQTGSLASRLDWLGGLQCVRDMVLLSLPAMASLAWLMRRGAAADTNASALTTGLAAAAWGAFVFVFACPSDDVLYIAVWYVVGCGLVTLLARMILPPLTRW